MERYVGILSQSKIWRMDFLIFVTLGTQDKPFNRLLEALEYQIHIGNIKEEVVVQAGCTKFKSSKMNIFDLVSQEIFKKYITDASFIVTHGGVGTIVTALKNNKKIIAVPRLFQYGEHVNDHQLQILRCFEKKGFILPLYDFNNFENVLNEITDFIPKKYISNADSFTSLIDELINADSEKKEL